MEQLQLVNDVEQEDEQSGTKHRLVLGDARRMSAVADDSVALVVTSPPYWILKKYPDHPDQLGDVLDFELFGKSRRSGR